MTQIVLSFTNLCWLVGVSLCAAMLFIAFGYAMGRNSARLPMTEKKKKAFDPGPAELPEDDPFLDHLPGGRLDPQRDEKEESRVETMKGGP